MEKPINSENKQILYKYTILGNPKSKKNNMRPSYNYKNGKFKLIQSQSYLDFAASAKLQLLAQMRQNKQLEPINQKINLKCIFYRSDHRRTDLVNLLNATCDILTDAKIIADDNYNIVMSTDGSRVYYDKANPRTEITISLSNG